MLAYSGGLFNTNETFGYETNYDGDAVVRVYNSTSATEVSQDRALTLFIDFYSPNDSKRKYMPQWPSKTTIVNLNKGDELKLEYFQYSLGNNLPTGNYYIGNGELNIVKIGQ